MKFVINGTTVEVPVTRYTFSSGLTNTDGTISVTKPIRGVFTQEEFDALPEEEKNSGMCVVDDGTEDSGGSSSSTMYIDGQEINLGGGISEESLIEYSETPVQIGTWGNRKIYRKFLYYSFLITSNATDIALAAASIPSNSILIDVRGIIYCGDLEYVISIPSRWQGSPDTMVGIKVSYLPTSGLLTLNAHKLRDIFPSTVNSTLTWTIDYIEPGS